MTIFFSVCEQLFNFVSENEFAFIEISRSDLWQKIRECPSVKSNRQHSYIKEYVKTITRCPDENTSGISVAISNFLHKFKEKWRKASRNSGVFLENNRGWLESKLRFKTYIKKPQRIGRPLLDFSASCERSKRQKTADLRQSVPVEAICYAAQMELRKSGNISASKLVHEITTSSPNRASKYISALDNTNKFKKSMLPPEKALSVFVEGGFSRHQYDIIRENDRDRFPSYKAIQEQKKRCYPLGIEISSLRAEVKVQDLLNHTSERILTLQKDVLQQFDDNDLSNLFLICKYGFDGSSGFSEYKQKFENSGDTDASAFVTWLVPLKLVTADPLNCNPKKVIWHNPCPSSSRYCRPIRLQFIRETTEITLQENVYIASQIDNLQKTSLQIENRAILVKHTLIPSMIDGKVRNALTGNKCTQKCYVCLSNQKEFNNIDLMLEKPCNILSYQFAIPVLHARIRFFEYLLHLAYKLEIKSWSARSQEHKEKVTKNKKRIQKEFKEQLGLIIDKPKAGFGSSNDGNTARRFFENLDITAKITRLDINILRRLSVVLEVITSYNRIDENLFKSYTIETARLLVATYPWYHMTPTVHLILIHGPEVIRAALLPVGQLSEEAAESRNKDVKKYRERFSRKVSRTKTNEDIFKRLLLSSDPFITGIRRTPKLNKKAFSQTAISMFLPSDVQDHSSADESSSDSD